MKKILKWLSNLIIENTIVKIIFFIISIACSGTIATDLTKFFNNFLVKYNISNYLFLLICLVIIESLVIFVYFLIKNNIKNIEYYQDDEVSVTAENTEDINTFNDCFEHVDYYFDNYTKSVTIYKNGHGIVSNKFGIIVNNPAHFREFRRKLNIEDGMKDSEFPSLHNMKLTRKENRFKDFGFWLLKDNTIVRRTVERYWSDNYPNEETDENARSNPKELRWVFEIDNDKIESKKEYTIFYALSIPGMYPIKNGRYDSDLANMKSRRCNASTSIHIEHYAEEVSYVVSFENGIELKEEPICYLARANEEGTKIKATKIEYGLFYTKYIFNIKLPSYGSNITVRWQFKEKPNPSYRGNKRKGV